MTPEQVTLIRESFARVAPVSDRMATMFYARLFEIAPELRPLFKSDIVQQGRKFMATLTVAVTSLDDFERLRPAFQALARQHFSLGVRAENFAPLGEALIWALGQGLGDDFTEETRAAWEAAYASIAAAMKSAAAQARS
ncbi:globin domain-containing protein [Rhodoblastus sp.]|uniref:globin domain-containing protein n=1 Tax=Rhodoblastus sp. TaxID=1962975 RepID=UPI002633F516|nr:globin domain-containing protein [Rhodoblastus sp.]